jgi:hypothetical protein
MHAHQITPRGGSAQPGREPGVPFDDRSPPTPRQRRRNAPAVIPIGRSKASMVQSAFPSPEEECSALSDPHCQAFSAPCSSSHQPDGFIEPPIPMGFGRNDCGSISWLLDCDGWGGHQIVLLRRQTTTSVSNSGSRRPDCCLSARWQNDVTPVHRSPGSLA